MIDTTSLCSSAEEDEEAMRCAILGEKVQIWFFKNLEITSPLELTSSFL